MELFGRTLGQAQNPQWHLERKFRLSASKAHKVLRGRTKETRINHFFATSVVVPSMRYGMEMEKKAREKYVLVTGKQVLESGLFVRASQPWMAASPDGIVIGKQETRMLEIKCPSSCQDGKIEVDYIQENNLKKSHMYYTQVQLQMYVTNTCICDFFVFSEADYKMLEVPIDHDFL